MRNPADAHLDRVIEAIRNYLLRHPGAADSEVGIAQWWLHDWLQESGEVVSAEEVRRVLDLLVQRGEVEVLDVAGAGRLWRSAGNTTGK